MPATLENARLSHPDLGDLDIGCDPYVVTQLQIGSPTIRSTVRDRALSDGMFDDTTYRGSRAITVSIRLKDSYIQACSPVVVKTMQDLLDQILPYMSIRRRPTLSWVLPGGHSERCCVVRGDSWPFNLQSNKYQSVALGFVVPSGVICSTGGPVSITINPTTDTESGREYPEDYTDGGRGPYDPTGGIGERSINNIGNDDADWIATIYGSTVNPVLRINGVDMSFTRDGGLSIGGGQSVVINTHDRTILLNGDPTTSVYNNVNFEDWQWDDVRLRPMANLVRFSADTLTAASTVVLEYTPTWLG